MITLPQLITTDTDVAAGLQSGKAVDSPEDFLALLAGALGAGDAQGKDAPLSLADLKAAGSKLQKGLLQKNGDATPSVKLTDLLAQQELHDAPRDKCVHFREINGIAAAFQYLQKNYNPTAAFSL